VVSRPVALLRASHIQPTLAVTAISTALAVSVGRGRGAVAVALAVLAGQLSVGWSNDYLDRERDRRVGRRDKPIPAGEVPAAVVGGAAATALVLCVPLSLLSGWRAAAAHLVGVVAAWAYNGWLKATVASVVPYALAFGLLPAFVTLGLAAHPWPRWWAMASAALLGAGAHFVNTLSDRADDALVGVRGLPHRFRPTASLLVGAVLLGAATLVGTVLPDGAPGPAGIGLTAAAGVSLAAVVGAAATGRSRGAWSLTLCTAALAVSALLVNGTSVTA
jgi:4-hydroxybenzoate polyprenyltransferase